MILGVDQHSRNEGNKKKKHKMPEGETERQQPNKQQISIAGLKCEPCGASYPATTAVGRPVSGRATEQ